ncbi:MAG: protogloblin ApPgb [Ktedonobacteraceae bacterium]|nr:protogloblin ApPgb [Ktedonobacteraceae bacterium]
MSQTAIPGYTYGTSAVPRSPVSLEEFQRMKETVLFSDEDVAALRMSRDILADQVEAILDVWYGFVASHPHLLYFFSRPSDGQPDTRYLAEVRKRFGQWILDTAAANYDQAWLDYQYEIGLRHHRVAKNRTDHADAAPHINFRYLTTLIYPITATLKPFLAKKGHADTDVEKMHQAWLKSVLLQVTLWCYPYIKDGDF